MDTDVRMVPTRINDRWELLLPDYRAERPEWTAWEVERLNSLANNIGPGDVVYDIGTEEGDMTAIIQSLTGPRDGGVCLFEPNDLVWPNVRAIWEANKLKAPIHAFHGYASNVTTADYQSMNWTSFTWPDATSLPLRRDHGFSQLLHDEGQTIKVDDYAILVCEPSVINIDVEGAEMFVILGAEYLLRSSRPLVYCSIHPEMMAEHYDHDFQDLYDFMGNALGYRSKILETDHEIHVAWWHPDGRQLRL